MLPNISLNEVPEPEGRIIQTILENQIYVIPHFLSRTACQALVDQFSTQTWESTNDIRVGEVCRLNSLEDAQRLWKSSRLDELASSDSHIGKDELLGLNPNIRVYRYRAGQFFGPHYDRTEYVKSIHSQSLLMRTLWTLLIYLKACKGGQTTFYPAQKLSTNGSMTIEENQKVDPIMIENEEGLALLHRHGPDCLLHEGNVVVSGEKWVLRTDICIKL